ncbi:MAG TPA: cellulase family glycosylhydrolase [Candidatus Saccharimonadales bacterium]|nr:cellulase family glycosylhydrolase [Candidatus Saccharimonadales bacterium]
MPAQNNNRRSVSRSAKKPSRVQPVGWTRRRLVFQVVALFALVAAALMWRSFAATTPPAGFVYRNGRQLMLNGATYQFVGFDAFGITGCEGSPWTRSQLDAYFAQLPPASVTRFWAFKQGGTATIDQVVASAEAHNQKVVPVLDNDLSDCNDEGAKNSSWYASGYKSVYVPWVQTMAARYKDSPAIAYWETINEAGQSSGEGSLNGTTMQNFYNTVAGNIKAIDPNHLVSTGDNAEFNYSGGASAYQTAASGSNIDMLSLHDYEYDYVSNAPVVSSHFASTKAAAMALDKPIVIGEMNLSACNGITTTARATILKQRIAAYLSQAASGVMLWNRSQVLYGTDCSGENYVIAGNDPAIAMIQGYAITGVVATPPTGTIPTGGATGGGSGTGGSGTGTGTGSGGSGSVATPPVVPAPDTTKPSVPGSFQAPRITRSSVTLQWNASTDNVGVKGYQVYRNGSKIADQSATSLTVYGLASGTTYTFMVRAYDAAGNFSGSTQISIHTPSKHSWWW